jgi:hypothetical protein
MIEFEDSEAKYDFEDVGKKHKPKVAIRIATMLVIFLMIVLTLAKNDFDFNFMKASFAQVPQKCDPEYSYNPHDTYADSVKNAENVLKDNVAEFSKVEGFSNGFVLDGQAEGKGGETSPKIIFEFDQIPKSGASIPQKLCGFKVTAVYK